MKIIESNTTNTPEFHRLFEAYWRNPVPKGLWQAVEKSLQEGTKLLQLYEDSQMIGFLLYKYNELNDGWFLVQKTCLVRELYVSEPFQHQGYGSACLTFLAQKMKDAGIYKLILTTEEKTCEFYKRNGFVLDSSYLAKNEDLVMVKNLG